MKLNPNFATVARPLPVVLAAAYVFMTHFAPDRCDVFGRAIKGRPLRALRSRLRP